MPMAVVESGPWGCRLRLWLLPMAVLQCCPCCCCWGALALLLLLQLLPMFMMQRCPRHCCLGALTLLLLPVIVQCGREERSSGRMMRRRCLVVSGGSVGGRCFRSSRGGIGSVGVHYGIGGSRDGVSFVRVHDGIRGSRGVDRWRRLLQGAAAVPRRPKPISVVGIVGAIIAWPWCQQTGRGMGSDLVQTWHGRQPRGQPVHDV
mmetsp:Transcript_44410/g.94539  ORF Transcript_44410/g.94539 Transcript_44410/m.94539 type:complete len:204 (+) Transcript_44410:329-940(+)